MTRITPAERDVIAARLTKHGFADEPFTDEFAQATLGRINIGATRAAKRVIVVANRRLGMAVKYKTFRLPEDDGGVVLVARADQAERIFAEYGEGFFS